VAAGYAYPGRVVAIDPAGPIVVVPLLAASARWGPMPSAVPDLAVGEQVVVTNLGGVRDNLFIFARLAGRAPTVDEIPGLAATLDAHDIRLDAVELDNTTDQAVLDDHDTRLTAAEGVNATQDTRLTAAEGVNATQNGRLDGIDTLNTTQNNRLTATETVADTAATDVAAAATAITTLRADTAGRVDAKGDLLAATAADTLARLPVGANGLALVADSAQATGLAYAERRGVPLALNGATSPTRYIGAIATAGPPIAPLIGAVGDFVLDSAGDFWMCTAAGTPGTWVSKTAQANTGAQHGWFGTGAPSHNTEPQVTGWTAVSGNATIATNGGASGVLLNRAGRWGITAWMFSDLGASRYSQLRMNWASGALRGNADLLQGDHAQGGYSGSGFSWVHVSWAGWVTAAQAAQPIKLYIYQSNANGSAVSFNYYLDAYYMGGAA
jgi:hypothetical protein